MADPMGQPVQPGERRGMSVLQRFMLLAVVYCEKLSRDVLRFSYFRAESVGRQPGNR